MSQEYSITWVGNPREWRTHDGHPMLSYEIEVDGVVGKIEWARKPESDAPLLGHPTPLATIENGPHGKKLKVDWDAVKEQKAGRGTSSAGSANLGGGDYARPLRPEVQAAIQRQHSQEMALRWVTIINSSRVEGTKPIETLAQVFKVADAFDNDVGREAAPQGSGGGSLGPPAPSTHPAPVQPPSLDISEMEQALQGAGVGVENSRHIANYMALKLEPSRAIEAVRKLTNSADLFTQEQTVAALTKLTEAELGRSLGEEPPPEDDIPF